MCPVSNYSAYPPTPFTLALSSSQNSIVNKNSYDKNMISETITIEDDNANHAISMMDKSENREVSSNDIAKINSKMNFEDRFFNKLAPPTKLVIDTKPLNIESTEIIKDLLDKTTQSNLNKQNEKFSLKTSIPISKLDFKTVSSNGDIILPTPYNSNANTPKFSIHSKESKSIINSENKTTEHNPSFTSETNGTIYPKKKYESNTNPKPNTFVIGEFLPLKNDFKPKNYVTDCQIIKEAKPIWGIQEKLNDVMPNQNHQTFLNNSNTNNKNQFENNNSKGMFKQTTVKSIIEHFKSDNSKHVKFNNVENEAEKKIVFIPSINVNHSNMMLALSQPTPITSNSILIAKNIPQEGIRSNSPIKKPRERLLLMDNVKESKVVALKRLHQDNFDENDFENLITENQIYGNKIVIKEKSQTISSKNMKTTSEPKNVQPNYLYMNNSQLQPKQVSSIILTSNNKVHAGDKFKDEHKVQKVEPIISTPATISENHNQSTYSSHTFRTVNPLTQSLSYVKTNILDTKPTNVLQNLLNKPNIKINESQITHVAPNPTIISQVANSQIVYHVPITIERDKYALLATNQTKPAIVNSELALLLSKQPITQTEGIKINPTKPVETKSQNEVETIRHSDSEDSIQGNKLVISEEVVSSLDIAEKKRKKKRESKRLKVKKSHVSEKKFQKPKHKENAQEFRLNFRQYQLYVGIVGEKYFEESTTEESESESEEDEVQLSDQIRSLTADLTPPIDTNEEKVNFLNHFGLTTISDKNEKELEIIERCAKNDLILSAQTSIYENNTEEILDENFNLPVPVLNKENVLPKSDSDTGNKLVFFNELKLGMVSTDYKMERENMWKTTIKERKKRNGSSALLQYYEQLSETENKVFNLENNKDNTIDSHTRDQLEIMTEIKKSVSENNNLIKRAIDNLYHPTDNNSKDCLIPSLAEKNFSEISKLSNMANRSLKMFARSQNIKNTILEDSYSDAIIKIRSQNEETCFNVDPVSKFNIPNVPKIISLKTVQDSSTMDISPATSMDEPRNSAAGVSGDDKSPEITGLLYTPLADDHPETENNGVLLNKKSDAESNVFKWPGIDSVLASYKKYAEDCENERGHLIQENGKLLQEIMALQTEASNISIELHQLVSKQQMYEEQRRTLQNSLEQLNYCIEQIAS